MRQDKIKAAKKLAETLESDLDFDLWLDDHPNEEKANERIKVDLSAEDLSMCDFDNPDNVDANGN